MVFERLLLQSGKFLFHVRTVDENFCWRMTVHLINVLITLILPCIVFSEDSILWDKYTRYTLSNHRATLENIASSEALLCSFVWNEESNYAIRCGSSLNGMMNLAHFSALITIGSEFTIEELNEKSCGFQPCLRIKIPIQDEFYCLDVHQWRPKPIFNPCDFTSGDQKWSIKPFDAGREPAHFLTKTTSAASKASSLFNEEVKTFGRSKEPIPLLIKTTPTWSEASSSSSMENSRMLDQIHGNFHIDSTTSYSTVSRTTPGLISSIMPKSRSLNSAKLPNAKFGLSKAKYYQKPNAKFGLSKESTKKTSFVAINHTTLKNKKVNALLTSSRSIYTTKGNLTKGEAKTPSLITKMLIPKNGIVSAVESQNKTVATGMTLKGENSSVSTTGEPIAGTETNIHIDSKTNYSKVSRTITETFSTLGSFNGAKLSTNSSGDVSSELSYPRMSTTMTSSIPLTHSESKNQRVDAFPASSGNMYAATSYLTKSEAKTLSGGKVSAVWNQDDTKAINLEVNGKFSPSTTTAQPIDEAGSVNLLSPLSTVKQCQSTCLQEVDKVFKNCYNKDYVFYNGTKIPCNPMPETYQIVSKFMNMFGSMWVVGTSMTSAVLTLAMVPKLFVNQIQCGQDIMLGFSHFMIMFFVFRVDNKLMCKITATMLIIFHGIYGNFILLECICVHLSLTNTLNSCNTALYKSISCIAIFSFTIGILVYLICFSNDLPSDYSCWINYNNHVSKSILTLAGILFSMSMIFIEAGISGMHKFLPTMQKEERKVCEVSAATLVVKVILSTASFILTSYAVFSQNFTLFPTSFGINVAFGWFNFFAHAICNKEVDALLVKFYCRIKINLKEICLYVSRKH